MHGWAWHRVTSTRVHILHVLFFCFEEHAFWLFKHAKLAGHKKGLQSMVGLILNIVR